MEYQHSLYKNSNALQSALLSFYKTILRRVVVMLFTESPHFFDK